jgi:hypothetical protein
VAGLDLYQVWQSPFEAEALPILTRECENQIAQLLQSDSSTMMAEQTA